MGANSLTSKAGTRSQKPTESSVLMVGAARQLNPVACSPGKIAALSLQSTPPGSGFQCKPAVQRSFEKVTARVKAVVPRPVRCTILLLKLRKPMPPSVLLPPSANLLGWPFMGLASHHQFSQRCHSSLVCQSLYSALDFIRMIRRQFHGHRVTTAAATMPRRQTSCEE